MSLSSRFTEHSTKASDAPPPPLIGALLRIPFETVRDRMLAGLHERGYTDLIAAHLDVFQYPGPENQRPIELAAQTRMSKQALNYLLGQLEQLGYLTREADDTDQRSKRIRLTPRGRTAGMAIREIGAVLAASAGGPSDLAAASEVMRRHGLTPVPPSVA